MPSVLVNMSYPFYACRRIKLRGVGFSAGDKVPVHALRLPERKIVQLVETRKIRQDFKTPLEEQLGVITEVPDIEFPTPEQIQDKAKEALESGNVPDVVFEDEPEQTEKPKKRGRKKKEPEPEVSAEEENQEAIRDILDDLADFDIGEDE